MRSRCSSAVKSRGELRRRPSAWASPASQLGMLSSSSTQLAPSARRTARRRRSARRARSSGTGDRPPRSASLACRSRASVGAHAGEANEGHRQPQPGERRRGGRSPVADVPAVLGSTGTTGSGDQPAGRTRPPAGPRTPGPARGTAPSLRRAHAGVAPASPHVGVGTAARRGGSGRSRGGRPGRRPGEPGCAGRTARRGRRAAAASGDPPAGVPGRADESDAGRVRAAASPAPARAAAGSPRPTPRPARPAPPGPRSGR